jgi:PAS domain-containing protein
MNKATLGDIPYRLLVETSEEGVWMINNEAQSVYANQKMADMLGTVFNLKEYFSFFPSKY